MSKTLARLGEWIEGRLGDTEAARWFRAARGSAEPLDALLSEVGRAIGRRSLVAAFAERGSAALETPLGPARVGDWRLDEAARVWLVAAAAQASARPFQRLFELYDGGDTEIRAACVRALSLVEDDDREAGLRLVHDAGRTYLQVLMSAAWCDNPWSSEHLSDHDFRKAVLKALFCDVPVERILRLEERADAELAQSLCEFADEREAAGRPVPRAVWTVAALHPRPGLVARMIGHLEHPLPAERIAAARALGNARDPRGASFIEERLEREADPEVGPALEQALQRVRSAARDL